MPGPSARDSISLTARQRAVLSQLTKQSTAEQRLVERAKILLLADEQKSNSQIAGLCNCKRDTVIKWRYRWKQQAEKLSALEEESSLKQYIQQIVSLLSDAPRAGAPIRFEALAVCQILVVACQPPKESDRPITHWSARELRDEVIKRGIVPQISARTIGRFLKSGGVKTASNQKLGSAGDYRPRCF